MCKICEVEVKALEKGYVKGLGLGKSTGESVALAESGCLRVMGVGEREGGASCHRCGG